MDTHTLPVPHPPVCRHCRDAPGNRAKGLCWGCSRDPAVRALYVSTSKYARTGHGLGNQERPLPPEPTSALPGTAEKVAVLQDRAAAKVALWHPADPVLASEDTDDVLRIDDDGRRTGHHEGDHFPRYRGRGEHACPSARFRHRMPRRFRHLTET